MPLLQVPQSIIEENVFHALKEDIGAGDITAELIPHDNISLATVISREDCIFCGVSWFEETYHQIDEQVVIDWSIEDGDKIEANQIICTLSGSSQSIVSGERVALNFAQTLSATATLSARYAKELEATNTKVLDTRKTIPGLRMAQKYAVSCGGCENHRIGLFDAFLIKENHINACDGIKNAVEKAHFSNPDLNVQVEVENLDELQQAIDAGANRVLIDNFDIEALETAVEICQGKVTSEASGNITLKNIRDVAETGVEYISTGALTKDIKAIDLSMRFD
ncbi:MAG: carboxylating nicotinate-nucleotide diphosphorylase [Methylococcaceae bacterium]